MYYIYACPKCAHSIYEWRDSDDEYKEELNLAPLVKDHYKQWHNEGDLLWTDDELNYDIKEKMTKSETKPVE